MLVGRSLAIRRVCSLIEQVASTAAPVLITGESGTGKELAARTIHDRSPRRSRPFVAINCASLNENLIESELFGHERGAFTGALQRREGVFERANGGTLLLDEITEMRPEMQAKLLRVLQEKEVLRVGGSKEIRIDVRVVAASNRAVLRSVRDGHLREDLYYRLNVLPIELPPLRDRIDDVPLLADVFLQEFTRTHTRNVDRIDEQSLRALQAHSWPGNVRELQNAVERAVIVCTSSTISLRDLPKEIAFEPGPDLGFTVKPGFSMKEVNEELIQRTIAFAGGNKTRAAEILGISLRSIYNRVDRLNGNANGHRNGNGRNGRS